MIFDNQKGYKWHKGAPRGVGGHWGISGVGCQGCIRGLAGSVGTWGQKGYSWHKGALMSPRGCRECWGPLGG